MVSSSKQPHSYTWRRNLLHPVIWTVSKWLKEGQFYNFVQSVLLLNQVLSAWACSFLFWWTFNRSRPQTMYMLHFLYIQVSTFCIIGKKREGNILLGSWESRVNKHHVGITVMVWSWWAMLMNCAVEKS